MKALRFIFASTFLLILILVLAVVSFIYFMDPNKLKPIIITEVTQKTGYQLDMTGNLSWSFYPHFSVKVEGMSLKSNQETLPFIHLSHVTIAADLLEIIKGNEKLTGDIYIDQVEFKGLKASNAHVSLNWQGEELFLQPFTAQLYSGEAKGLVHAKHLSETPQWDWDIALNQVQLQPLLQDMNGQNVKLNVSGTGDVQMRAASSGNQSKQIISNLNGTGSLNVRNGAVLGLDLNYFIKSADAFINGKSTEELTNTNQTLFDNLSGSFVIKNGVTTTDNLLLSASGFVTKASGVLDLSNDTLDYQLQIMPVSPGKIQWNIPLLVTGDLHSPSIKLDKIKLETMVARDQLEKVKSKVQDQVKKLPAETDKFLKKILGN